MKKKNDLYGAHLSVAGGLEKVFDRAGVVGAHAVQIFTKSNKSYFASPLTIEQVAIFKAAWRESAVSVVVTHAAYLINLAASDPAVEKKSIASLRGELERCGALGISYLVLHPGSHTGGGMAVGIEKIARNVSEVLRDVSGDTMILLETAAGQGTAVGSTFEELRALYDACDTSIKHRVGICLDTCHVWAAGYDLSTVDAYDALIKKFDAVVGCSLLKVVHLNDSVTPLHSRKDRHANLKAGFIPADVLRHCAQTMSDAGVAVILETPSDDGITEYREELLFLRNG